MVLSCELSCLDAPAQWYKDRKRVEESDGLQLESVGPHRQLIIPSAQAQDAGQFVCDVGGDSVFFDIIVTGYLLITFPFPSQREVLQAACNKLKVNKNIIRLRAQS